MNYEEICIQNKFLYGLLEDLTIKIRFGIGSDTIEALKSRKSEIWALIERNLEVLDDIWKTEATHAFIERAFIEPTAKELRIIEYYIEHPSHTLDRIGYMFGSTIVPNILTNYLTGKYIMPVSV